MNLTRISCIYFFLLSLASCGLQMEYTTPSDAVHNPDNTISYTVEIDDSKKAELAQARRFQIDQIRKGDYMMTKNNPKEALEYYLAVLAELPGDIVLERKIAIAYFLMKQWNESYTYFVRVPMAELSMDDQLMLLRSLFFDENAPDRGVELSRLTLSPENHEYF